MRANSNISTGTAITTTQAPSRNLVTRNTTTATAVITAPGAVDATRSRQRGGRSVRQWRTRPTWLSVNPMNTPIVNSGIRLLVSAPTAISSSSAASASATIAVAVHRPLGPQVEHVRQPVVLGQQAHQHRQAAEAGVGREPEHRA